MTEYKDLRGHDNPKVKELFEEHRKLRKESIRILQKSRKLEKQNNHLFKGYHKISKIGYKGTSGAAQKA